MSDLVEIGVEAMHEARARHFGERKPNRYEERGELYRAYMGAALTAIEKAGYRIVPVEPTDAMENAAVEAAFVHCAYLTDEGETNAIYRAMLAAAPKVS